MTADGQREIKPRNASDNFVKKKFQSGSFEKQTSKQQKP